MEKLKASVGLLSSTGLLPVVGWALLVVLLVGTLGGAGVAGVVVWKWKEGQAAIAESAELRANAAAWQGVAAAQQQDQATYIEQLRQASDRLGTIAQGREDDREEIRQLAAAQAEALELLRKRHPDWDAVDLGPEFVRHWNQANAGLQPAAAPATEDREQPSPAVPKPADATGGQADPDPASARPGGGATQGLPQRKRAPQRSGGRVGGDGLAVVLPGRRSARCRGQGLPA